MGGGAVAEVAGRCQPGEIDRLVLLAPSDVPEPERLQGSKLFIVSEGDADFSSVQEHFNRAPEPKKFVVLPGDAHAQHIFKTPQAETLTETILQWLTDETN